MITVKQVLDEKGRDVWIIGPNASVFEALKLMADKGIGALVVMESASTSTRRPRNAWP